MPKTMKKLHRKCLVCGKRILVTVYSDGHYKNGHYFNKVKFPVKGTGIYKKAVTTKLGSMKVDVVKWTEQEGEVEYWECNVCYEEAVHEDWLEKTLEKLYGKKCPDYEKNCACCQAWYVYDTIIDANRGKL